MIKWTNDPLSKFLKEKINLDILQKFWANKKFQKQPNLCVGVTNFSELVMNHSEYFVDRTMFIRAVYDYFEEGLKMLLFTRPSGWGKSVNLIMLKYYFGCEVSSEGVPLSIQPYSCLFTGGKHLSQNGKEIKLGPLEISNLKDEKSNDMIPKTQGQFTVIFLRFGNVFGDSFIEIKKKLVQQLLSAYEDHSYLKNTEKSGTYNIRKAQLKILLKLSEQGLQLKPISSYLQELQSMLTELHKSEKPCLILIDDIDHPIMGILERSDDLKQARKVAVAISQILNPILNSSKRLKIIATGRINALQTYVTGYKQFGIFDDTFYQYFGFTQDEVSNSLISPFLGKIEGSTKSASDFLLKKIVNNYGGYICSNLSPKKIQITSALKYLQACVSTDKILQCEYRKYDQSIDTVWIEQYVTISGFFRLSQCNSNYCEQPLSKQNPFLIQPLFSRNEYFLYLTHLNYVAYCYGLVTGEPTMTPKWSIRNPIYPNKSVSSVIGKSIIDKFQKDFKFKDLGFFNPMSTSDICIKFQRMLKYFYHKQFDINITFLRSALYYRHQYSHNKSVQTASDLIHQGPDMIDNIFLCTSLIDQVDIVHLYYQPEYHDKIDEILSQMVYEIVESNQVERALEAAKVLGSQIDEIVIKFILVMPDQKLEKLQVKSADEKLVYSLKEAEYLAHNTKSIQNSEEWKRLRRLGLLRKGVAAVKILNVLARQKLQDPKNLEQLIDEEELQKQRRFDPNAIKGPISRSFQPKNHGSRPYY